MRLLSKLFWRVILPFLLALVLTFVTLLGAGSGTGSLFSGHPPGPLPHVYSWDRHFYLYLFAVFLILLFANELRITLKWGKEAEEFEAELNEDRIEEERRHQAD